VSLQGTFDVFSLPELLRMFAAAGKSGGLIVDSGGVAGRIDLRDGECIAAENVELRGTVTGADALHARLVEVCFAVLRETGGGFRFVAGEKPAFESEASIAVEPVLAEVELLAAEWRELTRRLPSLDVRPVLVAELGSEGITLSAVEWAVLARCDGHTTVRGLVEPGKRTVVAACRTIVDLVDRGAVTLRDSAIEPATPVPADDDVVVRTAPRRVEPVAPYGPGIDLPTRAATSGRASAAHDGKADGGRANGEAVVVTDDPGHPGQAEPAAEHADHADHADHAPRTQHGDHAMLATPLGEVAGNGNGNGALDGDGKEDRGAILRLFSALREG
jgi:hypothetical protein